MIQIINKHPKLKVSQTDLVKLLKSTAKAEGREISTVTVMLVTDRKITKVHGEYLDDNTPTDVITFDVSYSEALAGDIIISLDSALSQAHEFGVTLKQETGRLAVHGLLHLCGLNDRTKAQRTKMHERENLHLLREQWITEV